MRRIRKSYLLIGFVFVATLIAWRLLGNDSEAKGSIFTAIGGVASFLFGILAAFTISDRQNRIEQVLQNGSTERGQLIMISHITKQFSPEYHDRVIAAAEAYLLALLDMRREEFYRTDPAFEKLVDEVISAPVKGEPSLTQYEVLLTQVVEIEKTRKHSTTLFGDAMSRREWIVLYFLSGVVLLSLLLVDPANIVGLVIIGGLSVSVFYIMQLIHDFDGMNWRVEEKIIEPYQKTLEGLGLERYYPKELIERGIVHNHETSPSYREGELTNYPDFSSRVVKRVVNEPSA